MKGKLFCEHKTINDIDPELLNIIKIIEEDFKEELYITSCVRCEECNRKAGGVAMSEHLSNETHPFSTGADVGVYSSAFRYRLEKKLYSLGIPRIGKGSGFCHVGISKTLPQKVSWVYD